MTLRLFADSVNARVKADTFSDAKVVRVGIEILVDHLSGDVLSPFHAKFGLVHGEVAVFVCSRHVVRPQSMANSVF